MERTVITTWLEGDYTKGTMRQSYRLAFVSVLHPGQLDYSIRIYSTAAGARRAAKRQGLKVGRGVAQGHQEARRRLGLHKQCWMVTHEHALKIAAFGGSNNASL